MGACRKLEPVAQERVREGEQAIALAQKAGGEQRIEHLSVIDKVALLAECIEHPVLDCVAEHGRKAEKVGPLGGKGA